MIIYMLYKYLTENKIYAKAVWFWYRPFNRKRNSRINFQITDLHKKNSCFLGIFKDLSNAFDAVTIWTQEQ